jgi:hypothetical protein
MFLKTDLDQLFFTLHCGKCEPATSAVIAAHEAQTNPRRLIREKQ